MNTVVDFHSHILPGVDDGSTSLEQSIAMLRMEAEQGIQRVVATPHFYPHHDSPERFLARRARAEAALREEMEKHTGLPELSIGAEVHYFNGISDSDAISELTIDKKRCILIEMPGAPWTDAMYRELEGLHQKQGLLPIIAHVDRYLGRFRTYGIPRKLEKLPVLVQANAEFFLDKFTAPIAMRMLKVGQIHLLGSDCHNLADRKPNLGVALERIQKYAGMDVLNRINDHQRHVFDLNL